MTKKEQSPRRAYKVRTPYNVQSLTGSEGKKCVQLSRTVPDQAIPLRVLLDRHTRGIPYGVAERTPMYEDEESNGINTRTLDLVDIQKLREANAEYIIDQKVQLDNEKRAKLAKEQEEAFEAEVKKRLNHGFIIDKDKKEPEK